MWTHVIQVGPKKHKVDSKCKVFNKSWTAKIFFFFLNLSKDDKVAVALLANLQTCAYKSEDWFEFFFFSLSSFCGSIFPPCSFDLQYMFPLSLVLLY